MKKRLVFILNPLKGKRHLVYLEKNIREVIDQNVYDIELKCTEYSKHGTVLAKEAAASGAYAVVAVGGDGTVNDITAGLLDSDTILAVLPGGSGNGLARSLKIPLQLKAALQLINKGKVRHIDVGFANGRPFISNAGLAFDAYIAWQFAHTPHHSLPYYVWLVTKHMRSYKEWEFEIEVDGKPLKEQCLMVSVANAEQLGYNFKLAPHASLTDGVLDLVVIRKIPKLMMSNIIWHAVTGTMHKSRYVTTMTGKEFKIKHPKLRIMQTDGDSFECANEVDITLKKGALPIMVP